MTEDKRLIAKVKFWFGKEQDIFKEKLTIEYNDQFAYIYRKLSDEELIRACMRDGHDMRDGECSRCGVIDEEIGQ